MTLLLRESLSIGFRISLIFIAVLLAGFTILWGYTKTAPDQPSINLLINKIAARIGVVEQNQSLIKPTPRYQEHYLAQAHNSPYPRILNTDLSGWNGKEPATLWVDRLAALKQRNEQFTLDCKNDAIAQQLICYFIKPSRYGKERIEEALSRFQVTPPKASGTYGNSWQLALFYDHLRVSPDVRASAIRSIETKIQDYLDRHLEILDGGDASLWHGRTTLAASAYLLASVLDMDQTGNRVFYSRAYGHFIDTLSALALTETWPEGYNYWLQERGLPLALALSTFKNLATTQADKQTALRLVRRISLWHIYLTRPDQTIEGWGDEGSRTDLKEGSRRIIDVLTQVSRSLELAQYSDYLKQLHPSDSYSRSRSWQLALFYDPTIAVAHNSSIPLAAVGSHLPSAELFGPNASNHLVIRSGWNPEDTFISFRASDIFTHHQHYDAGHFSLFKGEPLAVNSSSYTTIDADNRLNYAIRSIAKNNLLIVNPDETVKPNQHFTENVTDGGQRLVMPTGSAIRNIMHWKSLQFEGLHLATSELIAYEHLENVATFIQVDITRAYNSIRFSEPNTPGKVRRVLRSLIYLYPQDTLIVSDELTTTSPRYRPKWLLHTYNKFDIPGMQVLKGDATNGILRSQGEHHGLVMSHGDSRMTMDVLLPQQSQVTQIGGPDYRYYVEQDGDDSQLNGKNFSSGASNAAWFEQPQWRTEIEPLQHGLTYQFLISLRPRIQPNQAAKAVRLVVSKESHQSLIIGDTMVLLQSNCGAAVPAVTQTKDIKNLLRFTASPCKNQPFMEQWGFTQEKTGRHISQAKSHSANNPVDALLSKERMLQP